LSTSSKSGGVENSRLPRARRIQQTQGVRSLREARDEGRRAGEL
jgi:hypothetical protein